MDFINLSTKFTIQDLRPRAALHHSFLICVVSNVNCVAGPSAQIMMLEFYDGLADKFSLRICAANIFNPNPFVRLI